MWIQSVGACVAILGTLVAALVLAAKSQAQTAQRLSDSRDDDRRLISAHRYQQGNAVRQIAK
jgi:hypothetical protein